MPNRFLIVTTMKDEGPYILEWVAHHLAVGFDHIIAVTNDCSDGTEEILQRLQTLGHLTHLINPAVLDREQQQWQRRAQRYVQYYPVYRQAEWILHSDVDEFVALNDGIPDIATLVDRMQPAQAISLTSMPFSSAGTVSFQDRPVQEQFTELTHDLTVDPIPITAVKTLFRNELPISARTNHRPTIPDFSSLGFVWRDGSGRALGPEFTDSKAKTIAAAGTTDLVQLNHYAIRSIEAFLLKADRGDVANAARLDTRKAQYFHLYDQRGGLDNAHSTLSDGARTQLDAFLTDPILGPLHCKAVEWHRAQAKALLCCGDGYALARQLGLGDRGFREGRKAPPPNGDAPIDMLHARACQAQTPSDAPLPAIASFWTGAPLSFFEHLVIRSFTEAGHPFHLYALDEIQNLPEGVRVLDARQVLEPAFVTGPGQRHNNAVYSDLLRLYLVRDTGAIWADMDAYCLRPFVFPTQHVYGLEYIAGGHRVANGVFGLPPDSPALSSMIGFVETENPVPPFFRKKRQDQFVERINAGEQIGIEHYTWGTTGPRMLDHFLRESGEVVHAMPKDVFYPGPRAFHKPFLKPGLPLDRIERPETVSVHFFGKTKRFLMEDHGGTLPEGCYLDTLCKRHDISAQEHPVVL